MFKNPHFLILIILSCTLFTTNSIATTIERCNSTVTLQQQYQLSGFKISNKEDLNVLSYIDNPKTIYRSGCCSWHQGVCGCNNGRAICCDGSYSPSCGC